MDVRRFAGRAPDGLKWADGRRAGAMAARGAEGAWTRKGPNEVGAAVGCEMDNRLFAGCTLDGPDVPRDIWTG